MQQLMHCHENRHYGIIQTDKRVVITQDLKSLTFPEDRDIKEMLFDATYPDVMFRIDG